MTKEEKQFREYFQDPWGYNPWIQLGMERLDEAGVSAVQRATTIMALRRSFNTPQSNPLLDFEKHVNAVINEVQVG